MEEPSCSCSGFFLNVMHAVPAGGSRGTWWCICVVRWVHQHRCGRSAAIWFVAVPRSELEFMDSRHCRRSINEQSKRFSSNRSVGKLRWVCLVKLLNVLSSVFVNQSVPAEKKKKKALTAVRSCDVHHLWK